MLSLTGAALAAAPAHAATTVIDAGVPAGAGREPGFAGAVFSGPVLAGGRVLWAVRGPDGAAALRVADAAGNRGDLLRLGPDGSRGGQVVVSASGSHVLFQRAGWRCAGEDPCKNVSDEAYAGPLSGPLQRLYACLESGCNEEVGDASPT